MNKIRNIKGSRLLTAILIFAVIVIAIIAAPLTTSAANNIIKHTVRQNYIAAPGAPSGTFTYKLKPLDKDNPMPAGSQSDGYTFTIDGTRSIEIGPISYTREGNYKYELSQTIDPSKTEFTYDTRVYAITVNVSSSLNTEVIIRNSSASKVTAIEFENSRKTVPTDPRLMADPPVIKTVGGNPRKDSLFTFTLTPRDPSNPMPAGSSNGVKTIHITGSGIGEFGKWSYNKTGVYYYTVSELNAKDKGYTYDTAVYTITDTVTDSNGQLILSRLVTNETHKQVTNCAFINKYSGGFGNLFEDDDSQGKIDPKEGPKSDFFANESNPFGLGTFMGGVESEVKSYPENDGSLMTDGGNNNYNNNGNNNNGRFLTNGLGPKTGDNRNSTLYIIVLLIGGALSTGASIYLIASEKKRKESNRTI